MVRSFGVRVATGDLIRPFIALRVNPPSPYPTGFYFRSANTTNYSESDRMVSRSAGVSSQPHRPVQVENYGQLHRRLCFAGGYAFWRPSQAECDASVEAFISTRFVVDSRDGFDRAAVSGMSLFAMLRSVYSVNTLYLITRYWFSGISTVINYSERVGNVANRILFFCVSSTVGWNMVSDTEYFRLLC